MQSHEPEQFYKVMAELGKSMPEAAVQRRSREIMLSLYAGITQLTPVDTGRAQGGWVVTLGSSTAKSYDPGPDYAGGQAGADSLNATERNSISRVRPYTINWISNNVPYIGALERGHSERAANGMVSVTIPLVLERFNREL